MSQPVLHAYVTARVSTGDLPRELPEIVGRGDRRAIQALVDQYERIDDQPMANLVALYAQNLLFPPAVEDDGDWAAMDLLWQVLPSLEWQGQAPVVLPVPDVAWGYGAASSAVSSREDADLHLRVRLRVVEGVAGVMLIRPDGSALSDRDHRVSPEDGWVSVALRMYPQDGQAHILLRNYDCDGVAGRVEVQEVTRRWSQLAPPPATAPPG